MGEFCVADKIFELIEKMYSDFGKRFDMIGKRFDVIEKRFDMIEKKFDVLEIRFDVLENEVKKTNTTIEHEVMPKIEVLFDGQIQNNQQLERIENAVSKHEDIIMRKIKQMTDVANCGFKFNRGIGKEINI